MKLKAIITATTVAIFFMGTMVSANEVKGKVTHVRDADTIEVRGVPIRFDGVDAPDKGQAGFNEGKDWMKRNYANRMVRCVLTGAKTYDRYVGTCFGSKGENISAAVISAGWARDCPRYSSGKYRKYETARSRSVAMKDYCR
ncbi:thermonuclease family protein [Roseovarius arcticus]|uniref:thermonuclease family protein n=1 Tax=Roseovarius arcticus TaxID=2547404 RepID=UPI001FEA5D33|nr:thermonuclease family protein [Roseovarius arcticus]